MDAGHANAPQAILFVCGRNAVRSPIAAALTRHFFGHALKVGSAGVRQGDTDPFAAAVMDEIGIDLSKHEPRTLEEIEENGGLDFDLVVTLSPEAHHRALELTRRLTLKVEYWPTPDPTAEAGNRDQRLAAYRQVRDQLAQEIKTRFAWRPAWAG